MVYNGISQLFPSIYCSSLISSRCHRASSFALAGHSCPCHPIVDGQHLALRGLGCCCIYCTCLSCWVPCWTLERYWHGLIGLIGCGRVLGLGICFLAAAWSSVHWPVRQRNSGAAWSSGLVQAFEGSWACQELPEGFQTFNGSSMTFVCCSCWPNSFHCDELHCNLHNLDSS